MIGKKISHYEIIEKLGEGGMGVVYKARDTKLDRFVALKFLSQTLTTDKESIERFQIEAKSAAALNHPNIVTIHEIGEHDGKLFIAMEYLEGKTLRDAMSEKGFAIGEVIDIGKQICEGLGKAHDKGIVHRDIKPENIFIDNENRVKILDFGLVRMKGTPNLTKDMSTLGTLKYMSPEQYQKTELDQRTDIWSLGIVMFEMLTGKFPFQGAYEAAVMYSVLNEEMTSLLTLRKDTPENILLVVEKALEKSPDDRWQSVNEILEILKDSNADVSIHSNKKVASFRTNIPKPATPLLGREKEIEDLVGLLKENNVVTITGAGGIGKTRLALEICNILGAEIPGGVAFVSMATISVGLEVIPTLSAALDIKEAEGRTFVDAVSALISDKNALIVLDNLEHVISAAKEIGELSSLCPNLKILNTSRTPLKIKAEQEYSIHPLALPSRDDKVSVDNLLTFPSIALFTNRAKKVNTDFELTADNSKDVIQICHHLDGLPLAIELAATRIRMLSTKELLKRLKLSLDVLSTGAKDVPERQQTLRATIDWSYSLLTESEKILFRRLAVFSGGFTLKGIENVCYEDEESAFSALEELESLLDKGLVEKAGVENRFNMLQTINDFAEEKLKNAGEIGTIKRKHANLFLEISKNIRSAIEGNGQLEMMKLGPLDDSNILLALNNFLNRAKEGDEESGDSGLSLCGNLYLYWHIRGKHLTAKSYIESFLNTSGSSQPTIGKCMAMLTISLASWALGKYEQARDESLEAYTIAKTLNSEIGLGITTFMVGFCYLPLDMEISKKYLDEGENLCRSMDFHFILGYTSYAQGVIKMMEGDFGSASDKLNEALRLARKLGDCEGIALSLSGLAQLEGISGNLERSIELYHESLKSFESIGDRLEEARILNEMGLTYLEQNDIPACRKYTLDSIQAYKELGSIRGIGLAIIGLAAIEVVEHRPNGAVQIAAAAEYFAEQEGIVNVYGGDFSGKEYLDNALKELTAEEIEKATEEGQKLSLMEVIHLSEENEVAAE